MKGNIFSYGLMLHAIQKMLRVHSEIADELSRRLRLPYREQDESGNVCFVDSNEVRPEFKQVFSTEDVTYYLWAMHQAPFNDAANFPYPADAEQFWRDVELGRELIQSQRG